MLTMNRAPCLISKLSGRIVIPASLRSNFIHIAGMTIHIVGIRKQKEIYEPCQLWGCPDIGLISSGV
jgi:hypothetical protein